VQGCKKLYVLIKKYGSVILVRKIHQIKTLPIFLFQIENLWETRPKAGFPALACFFHQSFLWIK
jgi:hypothetical protein